MTAAGASVVADRKRLLEEADLLLSIRAISGEEVSVLKPDSICISLMDPFNQRTLVETFRDRRVSPSASR